MAKRKPNPPPPLKTYSLSSQLQRFLRTEKPDGMYRPWGHLADYRVPF
jgi:hypothetical protein